MLADVVPAQNVRQAGGEIVGGGRGKNLAPRIVGGQAGADPAQHPGPRQGQAVEVGDLCVGTVADQGGLGERKSGRALFF